MLPRGDEQGAFKAGRERNENERETKLEDSDSRDSPESESDSESPDICGSLSPSLVRGDDLVRLLDLGAPDPTDSMGGSMSSPTDGILRASLIPPLRPRQLSVGGVAVLGTYSLNSEIYAGGCFQVSERSPVCCRSAEEFGVPWPCHCCGSDCLCCPHAPRGPAWERALGAGFRGLLNEAGRTVKQTKVVDRSDASILAQVGSARALIMAPWTQRANAFLQPFGLSCHVFNWIEDTRDDKGNKSGEILRCAVQIYKGGFPAEFLIGGPVVPVPFVAVVPPTPGAYIPPSAPGFYPPPQAMTGQDSCQNPPFITGSGKVF